MQPPPPVRPVPPRPGPPPPPPWAATLLAVGTVLVGVWIVVATAVLQGLVWLVGEAVLASTGRAAPVGAYLAAAGVQAFLVMVPAGLLVVLARTFAPDALAVRATARAWLLAGAAAGLLGIARAVRIQHNEGELGLTAVFAAVAAVVILRLQAAENAPDPQLGPQAAALRRTATGFGLAAGIAVLIPWFWAGALGGVAETIVATAAAGATGLLAAAILDRAFFAGFARSRARQVLVGGLAAAVTLGVLASGLGGGALNLAELLVLPLLGFVAAALAAATNPLPRGWFSYSRGRGRGAKPALSVVALTALVGFAAFGPVAFVDPEEASLLLGTRDVGFWAAVAAGLSLAAALVIAVGYGVLLRPGPGRRAGRLLPAAAAAIVAVAATGIYLGAGRPGFYGDRLFVVMADQADQADLSELAAISDRPARLRATYERLVTQAERTQAPLRRSLARMGLSYTPYYLVNGVLVHGNGPGLRQWLSRRSDVDRVLLDQRLRPLPAAPPITRGADPAPGESPQWNVHLIKADRVWGELGVTGAGIVIGTSDSGVDGSHPALADGFRGGNDSWYDPWNATTVPTDHGGHGTHTLGSAEGRGGIGVAPGAQWVGCVNLDRNLGSPSHYLDCLQFMLAPFPRGGDPWRDGRPERAPHVLTNSWGCPDIEGCDLDALRPATAALRAAGVFVVAAAGNTGPRCGSVDDPPAPYRDVFTVGAVDRHGIVADFSSRGPTDDGQKKPDVLAPGVDVLSALPGHTYGTEDGTSMATPHVAGVVALMWSAQPRLIGDIDTTVRILRDTASPASIPASVSACGDPSNVTGGGLVDAFAAVRAVRALG